jgi:hypothetical protein
MSAYVSSGALSTFMTDTIGSTSSARMPTTELTLLWVSSDEPGSSWSCTGQVQGAEASMRG